MREYIVNTMIDFFNSAVPMVALLHRVRRLH
jgi:hypothetical protein